MNQLLGQDAMNTTSPVLCARLRVAAAGPKTARLRSCEMRLFAPEVWACRKWLWFAGRMTSSGSEVDRIVLIVVSPRFNSSLTRSLLRGQCDARRHGVVLLSGLLSQSKSGPLLQNARLGTWESRPLAWLRPGVTRADREFKNGDTIMYQNKATLMGFLGNDAEVRTGKNNQKFTTFSIATKTSYKDKESGEYISQTEWHRCIVFGKSGEFAATLKKGAHVQVEGEIRHTEYTPKKAKKPVRTDSIRVTSILKLDHAEKAAAEEQFEEEIPSEVEAA